jgi:uncharacterized protein YndB with AHSA1/START domain
MTQGETFRTSIEIDAAPADVFEHFLKPELLVRWMGNWARLDPRGPAGPWSSWSTTGSP